MTVATAKVWTLSELADEMDITAERVRQIVNDIRDSGTEIGIIAGNTTILTAKECGMVRAFKRRKYEKQKAS